jgi:chromosome segregation ATPase
MGKKDKRVDVASEPLLIQAREAFELYEEARREFDSIESELDDYDSRARTLRERLRSASKDVQEARDGLYRVLGIPVVGEDGESES